MIPHICKVCGQPGDIQTIQGRHIQRDLCKAHWRTYCSEKARARYAARRAARGLPPKAPKASLPPGWTRANRVTLRLPPNVTRLTLFTRRGLARLERGALMRETPLRYPERWQALARFYLNTGFRLVRESKTQLVLERAATS